MTSQSLLTLSQLSTAFGLIIAALGGYGSYYYQQKLEGEKSIKIRPVIDLCRKGISVTKLNDTSVRFDIPYCSGKNANAHNVKLESAIILKQGKGYNILSPFGDNFPDNITLTYEQGKSISYTLSPFDFKLIDSTYICVKGHFVNEDESLTIPVLDVYKRASIDNNWVRTLGNEDKQIRPVLTIDNW